LSLGDHAKEIPLVTEVHDDEDEVTFLVDLVEGHDVGMSRRKLMERDLPSLEVALSRVEAGAEKTLDGEVDRAGSVQVHCEVDHSVRADTKD
jgi:hypothetical protein